MARYLGKRLLSGLLAFVIFTAILFFGLNILVPGDYVTTLSLVLTGNEAREALRQELGLNLPLVVQYVRWLGNLVQLDMGPSFAFFGEGGPVWDLIVDTLPATVLVMVFGTLIAFGIGQWLGKIGGWSDNRWLTGGMTVTSILSYTAFPPWLAFMLLYALVISQPEWLPIEIRSSFTNRLWRDAPLSQREVMGQMVLSILVAGSVVYLLSLLLRRWRQRRLPVWLSAPLVVALTVLWWTIGDFQPYAFDVMRVATVPLLTVILLSFGDTALIMRTSMLDVRHETYVQTARAKGMPERMVRERHMARNALLPMLGRFVINIPYLFSAIVIVERAVGWPGIGNLLFVGIYDQNTNVYMGVFVIIGVLTLLLRLLLDVLTAALDPRVRFDRAKAGGLQ